VSENRYRMLLPKIAMDYGFKDALGSPNAMLDAVQVIMNEAYSKDRILNDAARAVGAAKGYYGDAECRNYMDESRVSTAVIAVGEAMQLKEGVVIHVRDPGLVEALIRTEVDAFISECHLPFPVFEICWPSGIEIAPGHQASGTLVYDMSRPVMRREAADRFAVGFERYAPTLAVSSWPMTLDGGWASEGPLVMHIDPKLPVDSYKLSCGITADENAVLKSHVRLAFAFMLYLQSVDASRVLKRVESVRSSGTECMPAAVCSAYKKRPHYAVTELFGPRSVSVREYQGGHHASPKEHWRVGHMRVLRDERFRRNPDGSLRAIWIRPVRIAWAEGVTAVTERKVSAAAHAMDGGQR